MKTGNRRRFCFKLDKNGLVYAVDRGFIEADSGKVELTALADKGESELLKKAAKKAARGEMVRVETRSALAGSGRKRRISWLFSPGLDDRLLVEGTEINSLGKKEGLILKNAELSVLTETSSALAHEFNQPLNIMRMATTNAETALKNRELATVGQKLKRIRRQIERAAALVEAVRRLRPVGRVSRFELEVKTREVLEAFSETLGEQGIKSSFRTENSKGVRILGSAEAFELMLGNLLNNAKEAVLRRLETREAKKSNKANEATSRSSKGRIEIRLRRLGDKVELRVIDDGIGIATTDRLFEPFFSSSEAPGRGMGLATAYNIASHLGGRLEAPTRRRGAEFRVSFPIAVSPKRRSESKS